MQFHATSKTWVPQAAAASKRPAATNAINQNNPVDTSLPNTRAPTMERPRQTAVQAKEVGGMEHCRNLLVWVPSIPMYLAIQMGHSISKGGIAYGGLLTATKNSCAGTGK
jgi:hypothetical protein